MELRQIRKSFGDRVAVRDVDLVVPEGATYGLLGPNGAGKTTAIRIALRILEQEAGEVRVFGGAVDQHALDRIGYLPEERGLYRRMRVRRALTFLAELKGVRPADAARRIDAWLERLGLADRATARVQELSKGMQQKLQFIGAILHEPDLVVLDEPFAGLDPINQQILKDIILDLQRQGRTILFSTHLIEHAERICDHVCIIARGEKVLDGPVDAVKRDHGGEYVMLTLERGVPDWFDAVKRAPAVARAREHGNELEVTLKRGADAYALLSDLVRQGVRLTRFERAEPSLEQIFLERVGALPAVQEEVAHV